MENESESNRERVRMRDSEKGKERVRKRDKKTKV